MHAIHSPLYDEGINQCKIMLHGHNQKTVAMVTFEDLLFLMFTYMDCIISTIYIIHSPLIWITLFILFIYYIYLYKSQAYMCEHLSSNTPWVKQLVLNYSFDCQGNDHLKNKHPVSIYMDNYGNNRLENNV